MSYECRGGLFFVPGHSVRRSGIPIPRTLEGWGRRQRPTLPFRVDDADDTDNVEIIELFPPSSASFN